MKKFILPDRAEADEIKRVRKLLKLTQAEFAGLIGTSKSTVERWEMNNTPVSGPIVLLLYLLAENPDRIEALRTPEKVMPLRLWYMYRDKVCSIIDADEINRKVLVHNYVENPMMRAFGNKEDPSWEEYQVFLESRCFPEGRDKMKLVLKDLNLPFYDPFMIIQKTEGRMAEDDFWIRIEQ